MKWVYECSGEPTGKFLDLREHRAQHRAACSYGAGPGRDMACLEARAPLSILHSQTALCLSLLCLQKWDVSGWGQPACPGHTADKALELLSPSLSLVEMESRPGFLLRMSWNLAEQVNSRQ